MKKLGRLIENLSELLDNLSQVDLYLNDDTDENRQQMCNLIAKGRILVAYNSGDRLHFAPSRFIGYLNNNLLTHLVKDNGKDGRDTTPAISKIIGGYGYNFDVEKVFVEFCKTNKVKPANIRRKYWVLSNEHNELYSSEYYEGSAQLVLTNRYERNLQARKECVKKYGCKCQICGMDFEKIYGDIGKGVIHVHHIIPISNKKGKTHIIDPKTNLIPVCPNCHAMLHRGKLSIEELKAVIENNK